MHGDAVHDVDSPYHVPDCGRESPMSLGYVRRRAYSRWPLSASMTSELPVMGAAWLMRQLTSKASLLRASRAASSFCPAAVSGGPSASGTDTGSPKRT